MKVMGTQHDIRLSHSHSRITLYLQMHKIKVVDVSTNWFTGGF